MPGLTDTASVLATSDGCPRQIIAYGRRVYGFQCHMEFTASLVEMLIDSSHAELSTPTSHLFVQQSAELRGTDFTGITRDLPRPTPGGHFTPCAFERTSDRRTCIRRLTCQRCTT